MKRTLIIITGIILLFFMLIFPAESLAASKRGLSLWFEVLLPSLLPFIILSSFLIRTNFIQRILGICPKLWNILFGVSGYGAYALILGIFCGYPMGAKLTADLLENGKIERDEAKYLLTIANNASPMFISGYILLSTLNRPDLATVTFVILYLTNFLCSLIFRLFYGRYKNLPTAPAKTKEVPTPVPLMELIDTSIMNGFESITKLGGYVILFSILAGLMQKIIFLNPNIRYIFLGLIEITSGIQSIASAPWPPSFRYSIILSVTAFGGISTIAQTGCMIQKTKLPISGYIAAKVCNGILAFVLCQLFVALFHCKF